MISFPKWSSDGWLSWKIRITQRLNYTLSIIAPKHSRINY
jgi:hypothetical protein